jgi:hypothetical protein
MNKYQTFGLHTTGCQIDNLSWLSVMSGLPHTDIREKFIQVLSSAVVLEDMVLVSRRLEDLKKVLVLDLVLTK